MKYLQHFQEDQYDLWHQLVLDFLDFQKFHPILVSRASLVFLLGPIKFKLSICMLLINCKQL